MKVSLRPAVLLIVYRREQRLMSALSGEPGVTESFEKLVLRFSDGTGEDIARSASAKLQPVLGNQTISQSVPLGKTVPKRMFINYNYDVLSAN